MGPWEQPDQEKLGELLLYVAGRLDDDPAGGATKLNKVLFFAEFSHIRTYGFPITGEPYQRLPQGPAPRHLIPVRERLIADGAAALRPVKYFGRTQHRLVPRRDPDMSKFSSSEIEIVDQVIAAFRGKSAAEVSRISHEEIGWQLVDDGEDIPFATAFLDSRDAVTETSRRHAEEIASRLGMTS